MIFKNALGLFQQKSYKKWGKLVVTEHQRTNMSDDKNIISLIAAQIAAFLFYEIKFLSKPNDKNFISSPILTRILSHFQQTNSGYCTISR
jgi:hypothetical protein